MLYGSSSSATESGDGALELGAFDYAVSGVSCGRCLRAGGLLVELPPAFGPQFRAPSVAQDRTEPLARGF